MCHAQVRVDVSEAGEVQASYTESPSTTLPVPIHLRAIPVDYFDVRGPQFRIGFSPVSSPVMMLGISSAALTSDVDTSHR